MLSVFTQWLLRVYVSPVLMNLCDSYCVADHSRLAPTCFLDRLPNAYYTSCTPSLHDARTHRGHAWFPWDTDIRTRRTTSLGRRRSAAVAVTGMPGSATLLGFGGVEVRAYNINTSDPFAEAQSTWSPSRNCGPCPTYAPKRARLGDIWAP